MVIKRFLIWFLKQCKTPEPSEECYKDIYLCANTFFDPIEDYGELYEKWLNDYETKVRNRNELLDKTICPYIGKPCVREECSSYRKGSYHKYEETVSISERLIAKLEGRPPKQAYTAVCKMPSCSKRVF